MKYASRVMLIFILCVGAPLLAQRGSANTEIPGKGPCTNFPERYHELDEGLAWFYGCMHENPPAQTRMTVSGPDNTSVGQAFIADLKEAIKHSTRYQYVEKVGDGSCKCLTVVVESVADTSCTSSANSLSAISIVLLLDIADNSWNKFLGQWVTLVGRDRIAEAAHLQLAAIDTRMVLTLKASGGAFPERGPSANTELPGKGPCSNFPERYDKVEERLAWFYGCMHEDPPSIAEIKAKIAAFPPEKRNALEKQGDFATQEALLGVASYDLPIQIFPDK